MYCHFMLADYITISAAPPSTASPDGGLSSSREHQAAHLLPAAAAALKPGACALYGACSPAQVRLYHMPAASSPLMHGLFFSIALS